jgi:cold shock CspA family protein
MSGEKNERRTGAVISVVPEKGFAFIQPADYSQPEIFTHFTRLANQKSVKVGDVCEYNVGLDRHNRPIAINVTVLPTVSVDKPTTNQLGESDVNATNATNTTA